MTRATRVLRRVLTIGLLLPGLACVAPRATQAAPEGTMTWGLHVTLASRWLDPAETEALITPFMVLYAIHDAVVKPMPAGPNTPSLAESWSQNMGGSGRPPTPPALGAPRRSRGAPRQRDSFTASQSMGGSGRPPSPPALGAPRRSRGAPRPRDFFTASQSKDGLVYEFVLRKTAKFHNGDPVTAEDVKFSFERYKGAAAKLLQRQAREPDRARREALLHQIQKILHDRVMHAPIYELAFLWGVGSRVEEPGADLIKAHAYSAPYEDLRLKK